MPLARFTGLGLFHRRWWYCCLQTYINQTEPWTSKRHFSVALTQFPCPHTLGVLLKPWYYAFATCHRTCCAATCYRVGKSNASGSNSFFSRDCFCDGLNSAYVPLLCSKASICIFLRPKLWGFCVQNTNNVWPQQIEEGVQPRGPVDIIIPTFE